LPAIRVAGLGQRNADHLAPRKERDGPHIAL
jgi:hypothetical protein